MGSRIVETLRRFHALDLRAHDALFSGTLFHVDFWVRRRLRAAVSSVANLAHGRLLDVGCGLKPYRDLFGHVTLYLGIEPGTHAGFRGNTADILADASRLPIGTATCDAVLCTEVLEHVSDASTVIVEIARVLKPGGAVIVTVPFAYPVHDTFDFARFTAEGLRVLFGSAGFDVREVRHLSSPILTLTILTGIVINDLCFLHSRVGYPLSLPLRPVLLCTVLFLNLLGGAMEHLCAARNLPFNHLLVATRRPQPNGRSPQSEAHLLPL